ncbi:hypothetical protein EVAR_37048_1 [Eumeta japonica]|uniref:Uncharacterized protein n=1 Tax=Eumeta variegata TaxID=151549 RepID=A0A4C1WFV2_EUMVA|nr:hypothetical protein EVAR_37048_1 [Eumeta japonica]
MWFRGRGLSLIKRRFGLRDRSRVPISRGPGQAGAGHLTTFRLAVESPASRINKCRSPRPRQPHAETAHIHYNFRISLPDF